MFVLPKPYADLHDTNLTHMCLVVALGFFKLCDPSEMSFRTCLIKIMCTPLAELLHWKSAMQFHPSTNNLYACVISYEVGSALALAFTRGRAKN